MAGGSTDTVLVEETEGEGLYDGSSVLTNAMAPITPDFWRENLRRSVATQVRVALKTGQLTGGTSGTEKLDLRKEIQKPAPDAVVLAPDPEPVVETAELGLGRVAIWVCSLKPGTVGHHERCKRRRLGVDSVQVPACTACFQQDRDIDPNSSIRISRVRREAFKYHTGPARTCREEQGSSVAATVCSWCRKEFAFLRAPAAQPRVPAPREIPAEPFPADENQLEVVEPEEEADGVNPEAEPALEALAEE